MSLVVPVGAIQLSDKRAFVFVVDGDVVHRREIQTGVDGGGWLEVTNGLRAGDRVVTAGIDTLADGMKIRVSGRRRRCRSFGSEMRSACG